MRELSNQATSHQHRLGVLLVTISAVTWSTAGYFTRLIPLDAWTTLFYRGLFGALTGLVYLLICQRTAIGRSFWRMGRFGILFSLMSTAGMVAFLGSLKLTTVAHVAIIYATIPFVSAALAYLVMRERTSPATFIASAVAGCGVILTLTNGMGEGSVFGDGLAVAMTMFMAAMIVMVRRAQATIDMIPAACLSALLTSVVSLPFASPTSVTEIELFHLLLFGLSNMGFGLILFTLGARHIASAQTALIGALDAPLSPIWAGLFNALY